MNPLESMMSRRTVIKGIAFSAAGLAAAAVLGCGEEKQDLNLALDYAIIDEYNLEEVASTVREKSTNFKLLKVFELPELGRGRGFSIPGLGQDQQKLLKSYGIDLFALVKNSNDNLLGITVSFIDDVQFSTPFNDPEGTPWPAFIFVRGNNPDGIITTYRYQSIPPRLQTGPLKNLWAEFPLEPADIVNSEFIVHFNARLFNLKGKDLPSFSLPYRFLIESIKPSEEQPQTPIDPRGIIT